MGFFFSAPVSQLLRALIVDDRHDVMGAVVGAEGTRLGLNATHEGRFWVWERQA